MHRFGGLVNLNVHFHLVVPDGVFVDAEDRLVFALHPVPTSADVLAILDQIVRRVTRRLADEACDDTVEDGVDVLAQVQAEAAATWRAPTTASQLCAVSSVCAPGASDVHAGDVRACARPAAGRALVRRRS